MAKYGPKPKPRGIFQPDDIPPWNCMRCQRSLPVSSYHEHKGAAYGYAKKCKECAAADGKANRENKGTEHWRQRKMMSNFGITQEQFLAMLAQQGGGCAVCTATDPGGKGSWHIDHDHACCPQSGRSCGECVRGVLCHHCNLMLGHAKDNTETLARAIQYLGVRVDMD